LANTALERQINDHYPKTGDKDLKSKLAGIKEFLCNLSFNGGFLQKYVFL